MIEPLIPVDSLGTDAPQRGLGQLLVERAGKRTALPLGAVQVEARVAGRTAGVTVKQTFRNPHAEPLEAVYIFPLPGAAAISTFELRVNDRVLKGVVKERKQARQEYRQAIDEGRRAALLEQERDDVFTVQVGNLPPGEEATVVIAYSERLPWFSDGETELRLPLVVAPRYIPGAASDRDSVGHGTVEDTDLVPDASRITPPRLAPGFDPKTDLAIEVTLEGEGGPLEDLRCTQHATRASFGASGFKVALARQDELLNRDFVLRWRAGAADLGTSLLVHRSAAGDRYGCLSIVPPSQKEGELEAARDVVFVLDRSGSMGGQKMTWAARACTLLLETLTPRDRYAVLAFDTVNEWLERDGKRFIEADEAGIAVGRAHLRTIEARGGTEMNAALAGSLDAVAERGSASKRAPILVLLTDGQVGDESRILARIQKDTGGARIFTIGIDTAVNEAFLRRLASTGRGTAAFVEPGTDLEDALCRVAREVGQPLVTDLRVTDAGAELDAASLTPDRLPDLFAGRPVTIFFRCGASGRVRIEGTRTGGGRFEETVEAREVDHAALLHLYARSRVSDLEDRYRLTANPDLRTALKERLIALSLRHTILNRFTAFVVVDAAETIVKEGETARTVVQPVHEPAGWQSQMASGGAAMAVSCMMDMDAVGFGGPSFGVAPPPPCAPPPPPSAMTFMASPRSRGAKTRGFADMLGEVADSAKRLLAGRKDKPKERKQAEKPRARPDPLKELRASLRELLAVLERGERPGADLTARLERAGREVLAALKVLGAGDPGHVHVCETTVPAILEALKGAEAPGDVVAQVREALEVLEESPADPFWAATI